MTFDHFIIAFLFYNSQSMYGKSFRSGHQRNSFNCVLILLLAYAGITEAFCPKYHWWDQNRDSCIKCTDCGDNLIVLRPCQGHLDTVCGTFKDLDYDFRVYAQRGQEQLVSTKDRNIKEFCFFNFSLNFN